MTQKLRYCFITLILFIILRVWTRYPSTINIRYDFVFLKHLNTLKMVLGDLAKLIPAHQHTDLKSDDEIQKRLSWADLDLVILK
jgi:hypothetical protein